MRPRPSLGTGSRLWIARHARVDAEWRPRAYGDLDVPLAPEGELRTHALAAALAPLRPSPVLASPLERARRLARELAALGSDYELADGLREIHRGRWQGQLREAFEQEDPQGLAAYHADPWAWSGHGLESDAAIAERAWPVVERAAQEARGAEAVLATHYNVARVLLAVALAIEPARSFALRLDPGRMACLVDTREGWVLAHLNVGAPPTNKHRRPYGRPGVPLVEEPA